MKVKIISESGYKEALLGMGLSFGSTSPFEINDISEGMWRRLHATAELLAKQDGGHNKFLESIQVWIDIDAPRYWWSQFDTYRVGITKQSESTMHTILKKELTQDDFEGRIHPDVLETVNGCIRAKDFIGAKKNLPEAFLQRRIVCLNYKTLRNIILQRKNHKLKDEWRFFIDSILNQLKYPL